MITIFINEHPLYLTTSLAHRSENYFFKLKEIDLPRLIAKLENNEAEALYLYDNDAEFLLKEFKKRFKIIEAAGGLVKNSKGEVLFIYRNGVWDLPKGKIEKGEKIEEAALREVTEECGINALKIEDTLAETYHVYTLKNRRILKITYWFAMTSNFKGVLQPQEEEGITRVEWINIDKVNNVLENTYSNIKGLIASFF